MNQEDFVDQTQKLTNPDDILKLAYYYYECDPRENGHEPIVLCIFRGKKFRGDPTPLTRTDYMPGPCLNCKSRIMKRDDELWSMSPEDFEAELRRSLEPSEKDKWK